MKRKLLFLLVLCLSTYFTTFAQVKGDMSAVVRLESVFLPLMTCSLFRFKLLLSSTILWLTAAS